MKDIFATDNLAFAKLEAQILQRMTGEPCTVIRVAGGYTVARNSRGRGRHSTYKWETWKVGDEMYFPASKAKDISSRAAIWRQYKPERSHVRFKSLTSTADGHKITRFWRAA